ncbi:hypothetical protein FSP39_008522 [Pinctada imbricata]|uniref:ELMO domain-containing protein n=1 Tax=Pinctada imbricata TaxID=66713 RepID=A0AA88Y7X4_PINIB|nr:hypothetical protein FSP39_008522 [Pinctada imbricata]
MWKWFLRKVTGKCELLRITLQEPRGAARTKAVERSLRLSNVTYIKQLQEEEDVDAMSVSKEIMLIKGIVPEVHTLFKTDLKLCIRQICGYRRLKGEVEQMRITKYSSEDPEHEFNLMKLWTLLMPNTTLKSRITRQWTEIGFQGDDPKTDFRGMGMLGLNQLLYFSIKYPDVSQSLLHQSHHPKFGFSYAIVGINLTSICYEALTKGILRSHFYNVSDERPLLQDFHEVYCYVFYTFVKFWFSEEPKDIMEFGRLRDKYKRKLFSRLKSEPRVVLVQDFQKKVDV